MAAMARAMAPQGEDRIMAAGQVPTLLMAGVVAVG
jgi:hypothetical protein